MDYDKVEIADVYDSGRRYRPEILRQWLNLLSTHLPGDRVAQIIDLGCGTGRYSEALAAHFGASVVAIDPSEKMLEQARRKTADGRVVYKQGSGDDLPFGDGSADMVFMSMVLHHLPDPHGTARECHRVLRRHGCVCMRNGTADAIETFPQVQFFPGIRSLMEEALPSRARTTRIFEEAGFHAIAHDIVHHELSPDWSGFADKMSLRSDSFLVRLPDEDFRLGLARLRDHAETADAREPVTEDVDFFVFRR